MKAEMCIPKKNQKTIKITDSKIKCRLGTITYKFKTEYFYEKSSAVAELFP